MEWNPVRQKMVLGISEGVFPGAVLLCARGSNILFHEAFGHANLFSKAKMKKNSIFDLASLTKPLATALAIERLSQGFSGLIHRRLGTVLQEFDRPDKKQITVDMLLRHTSGYPAHEKYYEQIVTYRTDSKALQTRLLVAQALENGVGTTQVYSDLGFMVLGKIIEKLSGMPLDRFVQETIYQPLGIKQLFFIPKENKKGILELYKDLIVATQKCPWRDRLLVGEVDDENAWAVGGVDGHAGLFGDAYSVFLICREILSALLAAPTKLVNSQVIQQMVLNRAGQEKVAGFDTPSQENSSSGQYFSRSAIGHLGFTGTSFWIDPETSLIVILLTNRIHPSRSNELLKKFRPQVHDLIAAKFSQNIC